MIDTDIFQIVTLVLLLLALIVSLVVLSSLGKMRRELESGGGRAAEPGRGASEAEPAAASAPAAAQARPAATAHPLEEASYGDAAAQSPAAQPTAAQPTAAQPAAAAEPQDQPFEKDGRWWFRRGDELLVYEESTGQWQPADTSAPAAGGTAPMPAAGGVATGTETGDAATGTEAAGHWKCPTCGAVNGSTAASCRMCFTPRP